MENNQLHKSVENIMLYNVAIKGLALLMCMFICTLNFYFAVMKFPSETSMYLSVYTSDTGTKSEMSSIL